MIVIIDSTIFLGELVLIVYNHKSVYSFFIMISDPLMPDLLNLRESALAVYEYDHIHNFSVYS